MRISLEGETTVKVTLSRGENVWFRQMIHEGWIKCCELGDKDSLLQVGVIPQVIEALSTALDRLQMCHNGDVGTEGDYSDLYSDTFRRWSLSVRLNRARPREGNIIVTLSKTGADCLSQVIAMGVRLMNDRADVFMQTNLSKPCVDQVVQGLASPRSDGIDVPLVKASSLVEAPPHQRVYPTGMLEESRETSLRWVGWLSDALWSAEIDFQYFVQLMYEMVVDVRVKEADPLAPRLAALWQELVDMEGSHLSGYGPVSVIRREEIEDVVAVFRTLLLSPYAG